VKGVSNAEGDVIRLRRSIGYVIQDVGLFPHFTVERNIGLVPRIEGWPEDRIRARVQELLQLVGWQPIWRRGIRISCRAGKGSGWAWRGRWRRTRRYF
jgi:ABC-type proline/glycine betaine transport system ATPase subunit